MNRLLTYLIFVLTLLPGQIGAKNVNAEIDSLKQISTPQKRVLDIEKRIGELYAGERDTLAFVHWNNCLDLLPKDSTKNIFSVELDKAKLLYRLNRLKVYKAHMSKLRERANGDHYYLGKLDFLHARMVYAAGFLDKSLEYFDSAIGHFEAANSPHDLAKALNEKGVALKNLGDYSNALDAYLNALNHYKVLKNERGFSNTLMNIGVVYKNQGDYKRALKYYRQAQTIFKNTNNFRGLANIYSNIGVLYKKQGKYDKALNEYMKALDIHEELGNSNNIGNVLHNVGTCLHKKGEPHKALEYLYRALEQKSKTGSHFRLSTSYNSVSDIYIDLMQYDSALVNNNKALELALKTGSPELLVNVYETRTILMAKTNDLDEFEKSWAAFKQIDDTLQSLEKSKLIYQIQADYDLQVEKAIKESREKKAVIERRSKEREAKLESEINKEKKKEKQLQQTLVIGGFVLLTLLALSLYSRMISARRNRKELENKNLELQKTLLSKEEKEVLLKEIHHRVKNNMQIIMSLLRLQSANINDTYIQSLYTESQNRIKSMALVHEELYQTRDLTDVNVKNYLEKLVQNLIENYSLKTNIITHSSIEVNSLGIDTLIPLGLLLNEIISNTFKHAFINQNEGRIYVELTRIKDDEICLKVGDNGIGFAADWDQKDSLGQELIESLTEQLDGTIEVSGDRGVHYVINFKEQ